MLAAPTHTIPVSLFELHGVGNPRDGGGSDSEAKAAPRQNATIVRIASAERIKTFRKSRGLAVARDEKADRYEWRTIGVEI